MNTNNAVNTNAVNPVVSADTRQNAGLDKLEEVFELILEYTERASIKEGKEIMERLEDLRESISDSLASRIPHDCLAKVESEYYLSVTLGDDPGETKLATGRILLESDLESLAGYAGQLLAEAEEEEARIIRNHEFFSECFGDDSARDEELQVALDAVDSHRVDLSATLNALHRTAAAHGKNAVARDTGLNPAVLEVLNTFD